MDEEDIREMHAEIRERQKQSMETMQEAQKARATVINADAKADRLAKEVEKLYHRIEELKRNDPQSAELSSVQKEWKEKGEAMKKLVAQRVGAQKEYDEKMSKSSFEQRNIKEQKKMIAHE